MITTTRHKLQVNVLGIDKTLIECLTSWNEIFLEFEFIITVIWFWNLCEHTYLFLTMDSALANAANLYAQVNGILMLNGINFKIWKDNAEIVLGCMELDLALRMERPTSTSKNLNDANIEKWERSNRLSLMLMKRSILEAFLGSITVSANIKKFLLDIEKIFAKNEKAETSTLLRKLVGMKYTNKENIREYIMEMFNIAGKLKALKLQLSDNLLVHLVLIFLPA